MDKKLIVRIIAFILAAVMVLGLFAGTVFASETPGSGYSSESFKAEYEHLCSYSGREPEGQCPEV